MDSASDRVLKLTGMIMTDIEKEVIEIIAEVCSVPENSVTLESSAGDFEKWDSMGHLSILREVSARFGISFDFNEMMSDEAVLGFFSSLELLGVQNTSDVPQA